jgi:hypothetical protein
MTEPMTNAEIEEIRKAEQEATPGPWTVIEAEGFCNANKCPCGKDREDAECEECEDWRWTQGAFVDQVLTIDCGEYDGMNDADAKYIALSRTAVPKLLDEVARLRAALEAAEMDINTLMCECKAKAPTCELCKHRGPGFNSCMNTECHPKWRGPADNTKGAENA